MTSSTVIETKDRFGGDENRWVEGEDRFVGDHTRLHLLYL